MGDIRSDAKAQIEKNNSIISTKTIQIDNLSKEIEQLQKEKVDTGDFTQQKAKLRELLDLTSTEHQTRQEDLVKSALNFVETAKARVGSVRSHLSGIGNQIDHLSDTNDRMTGIYAVISEGINEAEETNKKMRDADSIPPADETTLEKLSRESRKTNLEYFIADLDNAAKDTTVTYSDLVGQAVRIKGMQDANNMQLNKAAKIHTQGVAGVADRLSVVLQVVSGAAINESSEMSRMTLKSMIDSTNKIAQQESIKNAMGINDINDDLAAAIEDLASYGDVMRTSTEIARTGLTEMRENLDRIKQIAEEVRSDTRSAIAVNADVLIGTPKERVDNTKPSLDPFKL